MNKWILVSERLPESAGVYIVSRRFSDGYEGMILTDACYFDGTNWHNDNRINHSREYVDKKMVAWMPLPEPYMPPHECDTCKYGVHGDERCSLCCHVYADRWVAEEG